MNWLLLPVPIVCVLSVLLLFKCDSERQRPPRIRVEWTNASTRPSRRVTDRPPTVPIPIEMRRYGVCPIVVPYCPPSKGIEWNGRHHQVAVRVIQGETGLPVKGAIVCWDSCGFSGVSKTDKNGYCFVEAYSGCSRIRCQAHHCSDLITDLRVDDSSHTLIVKLADFFG